VVSPQFWVAAALLGGCGALARFIGDRAISKRVRSLLPLGTGVVNLSGAFALGLVDGIAPNRTVLLLVGTALLGAYTTYSTWMFESQRLVEDGRFLAVTANLLLAAVAGLGCFFAGQAIGRVA